MAPRRRTTRRRGGGWQDDIRNAFDPNKNGFNRVMDPNQNGVAAAFKDFGEKTKNEFVNPNSVLRGQVLPIAASVGSFIPGVGAVLQAADAANQVAGTFQQLQAQPEPQEDVMDGGGMSADEWRRQVNALPRALSVGPARTKGGRGMKSGAGGLRSGAGGLRSGAGWGSALSSIAKSGIAMGSKAAKMAAPYAKKAAAEVVNQLKDKDSVLRSQLIPMAASADLGNPFLKNAANAAAFADAQARQLGMGVYGGGSDKPRKRQYRWSERSKLKHALMSVASNMGVELRHLARIANLAVDNLGGTTPRHREQLEHAVARVLHTAHK